MVWACDPRSLDGVTVGEIRPLVEALGFKVKYRSGPPWTMRIVGGPRATRLRPKPKAKVRRRRKEVR